MGYEIVPGQPPSYGGEMVSPEAASPYGEVGHAELIDRFFATEGDTEIGRELSVRLFAHAGLTFDPHTEPLIGRNGAQVEVDGVPLTLADYVNFAAKHHVSRDHFEALPEILDFLMMQPGGRDYETTLAAMMSRLSAGRR